MIGGVEEAEGQTPETIADRALCQQALDSLPQPPRPEDWPQFEANLIYGVVTRFVGTEAKNEGTAPIEVETIPSGVTLRAGEGAARAEGRICGDFYDVVAELPVQLGGRAVESTVPDEPMGNAEYTVEWWMQRCQTYRNLADEVLSVLRGRWKAGGGRPSSALVSREAITIHSAHQGDIVHGYSRHRLLGLDWTWSR